MRLFLAAASFVAVTLGKCRTSTPAVPEEYAKVLEDPCGMSAESRTRW